MPAIMKKATKSRAKATELSSSVAFFFMPMPRLGKAPRRARLPKDIRICRPSEPAIVSGVDELAAEKKKRKTGRERRDYCCMEGVGEPDECLTDIALFVSIACRVGRVLEAQEEIASVGDMNSLSSHLELQLIEKISRVSHRCQAGAKQAPAPDLRNGWTAENVGSGMDYAFLCSGGGVQLVVDLEIEDCPLMAAVAGLAETDLSNGFYPGVTAAENLCVEADMIESVWLVSAKNIVTGRLEDTIHQVSVVDALSEPDRCVWVLMEIPTLALGCEEVNGVKIPPLKAAQKAGLTAFRLRPVGAHGVALQLSLACPNASAACLMPTFAMKMLARKAVRDIAKAFDNHVTANSVLTDRLVSGPRAEFYTHLQNHLDAHLQSEQ